MSDRADAHMHLFENGYRGSFTARPGVRIDEPLLYASLASEYRVRHALVVGYEGEAWAEGNNDYIAGIAKKHAWARPAAFVRPGSGFTTEALTGLHREGFVGLSMYLFSESELDSLAAVAQDVWSWIAQHRWVVSLNTRAPNLRVWKPILESHPELRLLLSHLALPPCVARPPEAKAARAAMADVLALARYSGVHVKLSGFYAVSNPGYAYPHRAVWPYVEALAEAFGPARLLWGSDFVPSLGNLSFPQTIGLFAEMPFFDSKHREAIEGGNLLRLLGEVQTGPRTP